MPNSTTVIGNQSLDVVFTPHDDAIPQSASTQVLASTTISEAASVQLTPVTTTTGGNAVTTYDTAILYPTLEGVDFAVTNADASTDDQFTFQLSGSGYAAGQGEITAAGGAVVATYTQGVGSLDVNFSSPVGAPQNLGVIETILDSVTYGNSSPSVSGERDISVKSVGSLGTSAPTTAKITLGANPTISGTLSGQASASESSVTLFGNVTIGDANNGGGNVDTLTIAVNGAGTLSGAGTADANGDYTLSGTAAQLTGDLQAMSFTPAPGAPDTSATTGFTLTVSDAAAGTTASDSLTSVVDKDPQAAPRLADPAAVDGYVNSQDVSNQSLIVTAAPGSTVDIYLDNNTATPYATVDVDGSGQGSLALGNLSNGTYSFTAVATDAQGASAPSAAYSFTVETTAPGAPTINDIADANAAPGATFDSGFSVTTGANVTVSVNGTALSASDLAADFSETSSGGLDSYVANANAFSGSEIVSVSATLTDAAGNTSPAANLTLNPIDTTAPGAPTINDIADANAAPGAIFDSGFSVTTGANVTVSVNGNGLSASDLAADFSVSSSGGLDSYVANANAFSGSEIVSVSATLTDAAGNTSPAANLTLNPIDTTAPGAPTINDIADANAAPGATFDSGFSVTTGANVTVSVNGNGLSASDLAADFSETSSGGLDSYVANANAFSGSEIVSVSATLTDSAGNTSPAANLTLNPIDTTAPGAPTINDIADANAAPGATFDSGFSVTTGANVTVSVNGAGLSASDLAADFSVSSSGGLDSYVAKANAFSGSEIVSVSATLTDSAGNTSPAANLTLNPIDTTAPGAPTINDIADANAAPGAIFDSGFSVTTGANVTVSVNGTALSASDLAADFSVSSSGGLDSYVANANAFSGSEIVSVSATLTDAAGNTSPAANLTLNPIDTTAPGAPTINDIADANAAPGATFDSGFSVTTGANVTVSVNGNGLSASDLAADFSETSSGGLDSYVANANAFSGSEIVSVSATLTDAAGNTSPAANLTLNPIDTTAPGAPTINDIADANAAPGATFDSGFSVTTGANVTVSVNGAGLSASDLAADFSVSSSGGLDSYVANANAFSGSEIVSVSATLTDSAGNTSPAANLTLNPIDTTAPGAPTINDIADANAAPGATFDSGFSVTTGANVTVSVNGVALSASDLAADFSETSSGGLDSYVAKANAFSGSEIVSVSATLTDSAGNTSPAANLTLNPIDTTAPGAPTINDIADANAAPGAIFDSGFSVTTGANVTVSVNGTALSASDLAADFSVSSSGGLDSYVANANAFSGSEIVSVSATLTDAAGNTSPAANLTLNPIDTTAPGAPTINDIADANAAPGATFDSGFSVTTGANVTVSVNGNGLSASDLAADFSETSSGGLDSYVANANAFSGSEIVSVSATLTDAAGNTSPAANLTLNPIDTTAPGAPTINDIADANAAPGATFDSGFSVTTGANVTVSVNGNGLSASDLAADFSETSSGGLDSYVANANAFSGSEIVSVSATLTDAAGNTSPAANLTLNPIDTTAPGAPTINDIADANAAPGATFDSGFSVTTGANVTVSVNGTALSASDLAADFSVSSSGGLDSYVANANAFSGSEIVSVSATLTDSAGNTSPAANLTLNPIDTTAPGAPSLTEASYDTSGSCGHWNLSGEAAAGSVVTVYNGAAELGRATANSSGVWVFVTSESDSKIRDFYATATDAAGNVSAPSAAYWEGTPGKDTFDFASVSDLTAAALIDGGLGVDTLQLTSAASLVDLDFVNLRDVEALGLTGASSVILGTNALADGLGTVVTGSGDTNIADSNSGKLTVNAAALAASATLTLTGSSNAAVSGLAGNLNASGDTGTLGVTTAGTTDPTVTTGSGNITITDNATAGDLNVAAGDLAAGNLLKLIGSSAATVTSLHGNLNAASDSGALIVTTTGVSPQTVTTGSGNITLDDETTGGPLTIAAADLGSSSWLTLTGSTPATIASLGGNLDATGDSGLLTLTATGDFAQTVKVGSGGASIVDNASGSVTVDATDGGAGLLTLSGHAPETVNNLSGNLSASLLSGPLTVNADGSAAQSVTTGTGSATITDDGAGAMTVDATAMKWGANLKLAGSANETVTNLAANLSASGLSGNLMVTTGDSWLSIATGSGLNTINAAALAYGQMLTLTGSSAATVSALGGNLDASGDSGNLTITATATAAGATTHKVVLGSGNALINDAAAGYLDVDATTMAGSSSLTLDSSAGVTVTSLTGSVNATSTSGNLYVTTGAAANVSVTTGSGSNTVNASAMTSGETLTLNGASSATVKVGGNLSASTYSGTLYITAAGSGSQSINAGTGNDYIVALNGSDTISGGGGADWIDVLGHTSPDAFAYGAIGDSLNSSSGHDTIQGFLGGAGGDVIDLSQINAHLSLAGKLSGGSIAADSIGWIYAANGDAHLYVNDTGGALSTSSSSLMEITLTGVSTGLAAANFKV